MSQEIVKNRTPYVNADIYTGTVTGCDPGTQILEIAPDGEGNLSHIHGKHLSSICSGALGFQETLLPGIGTRVLCFGRGLSTLVIGCLPYVDIQGSSATATMPVKSILGASDPLKDNVHKLGYLTSSTKISSTNNNLPSDVVQGEKVISNEFGVMLQLFKLMAGLRGSELAQIQCHFLDDLVRIISHNFQHFSSLGELKIYHDGKGINLEMGATHSPNESIGSSSASGISKITTNKDYAQFYDLADEQLVMLERMKLFVGKLGDFINLMITYPSDETHALNGVDPITPDTGLLQFKASLDGSLIVRSVNGIYLEKTNWIRVPQRIKSPEDPTGDDGTTVDYPKAEPYKFDNTYTYRDVAFLYYLQLKDFLAYINEDTGYRNFSALKKDFYVNDDINNETPLNSITYVDPITGVSFTPNKSWIALMNNGGVSMADAWNSCITMEGGNINIQPAKDLVLQPNRNLVVKVGGNACVAINNEIDISSTGGGLRIKTHNAQYLYSKNSGIILHADGYPTEGGVQTYNDIDDGDYGGDMIFNVGGIVLNAPNSTVNSYAQQIYNYATKVLTSRAPQITSQSSQITRLFSANQLQLNSNFVSLTSKNETINYSQGENILIGNLGTVVGKKGQYFGDVSFMGARVPVEGLMDFSSKMGIDFAASMNKLVTDATGFDLTKVLEAFKDDDDFSTIKFLFPPSSLYDLDDSDIIPQTLSQQTDVLTGQNMLQKWVEEPVNKSYPFPGAEAANSLATVNINNVSYDIDLVNKTTDLVTKSTIEIKNVFTDYKSL